MSWPSKPNWQDSPHAESGALPGFQSKPPAYYYVYQALQSRQCNRLSLKVEDHPIKGWRQMDELIKSTGSKRGEKQHSYTYKHFENGGRGLHKHETKKR